MEKYITQEGDQWDMIARRLLGNELLADLLMKANMQWLDIFTFGYGVELNVPQLPEGAAAAGMPGWRA